MRTLAKDAINLIDSEITLKGWVNNSRDHGGLIFIDLRDHTGIVQLTVHPEQAESFKVAETCRDEFVLQATGKVVARDKNLVNPNIPTGAVEVIVTSLEILNKSDVLPFP